MENEQNIPNKQLYRYKIPPTKPAYITKGEMPSREKTFEQYLADKNEQKTNEIKSIKQIDINNDGLKEKLTSVIDKDRNWVKSIELSIKDGNNLLIFNTNFGGSDFTTQFQIFDYKNNKIFSINEPLTSGDGVFILKNNQVFILRRIWDIPKGERRSDQHKYSGQLYQMINGKFQPVGKRLDSKSKYHYDEIKQKSHPEFKINDSNINFVYDLIIINELQKEVTK